VTLTNGADLDLAGFNIHCDAGETTFNGLCQNAVRMMAANSVVTGAPTSRITGTWYSPIDCAGYQGSRVEGVIIEGFWPTVGAGIYGCQFVENNVIQGEQQPGSGLLVPAVHPGFGIRRIPIDSNDLIAGNYVSGCHTGITTNPSTALVTIDQNTVSLPRFVFHFGDGGIDILHPNPALNPAVITNNVVVGSGLGLPIRQLFANTNVVHDNNVCRAGLQACASCVAAGYCDAVGSVTSP
jgi:hypothetical protein